MAVFDKIEGPPTVGPLKKPYRVRTISYVLVGLGLVLTLFYDNFAGSLDVIRLILQVTAIGCLLIGAILFFSVKEKSAIDRTGAYREVFGKGPKKPPDL